MEPARVAALRATKALRRRRPRPAGIRGQKTRTTSGTGAAERHAAAGSTTRRPRPEAAALAPVAPRRHDGTWRQNVTPRLLQGPRVLGQSSVEIPRAARVKGRPLRVQDHPHGITTGRLHLRARPGADAAISAVAAFSWLVSREDCRRPLQAPISFIESDAVVRDAYAAVRQIEEVVFWPTRPG